MSLSEMKAVVSSAPPDEEAFLLASREASLRFAAVPPPSSTALLAACIRKSLRSAKSAGVRICGRGGALDRSFVEDRHATPLSLRVLRSGSHRWQVHCPLEYCLRSFHLRHRYR